MLTDSRLQKWDSPHIKKSINIIVGGYGSGKSEVSVNLARHLVLDSSFTARPISILDLDIANPYFRSREASAELEKLGISPINPEGAQFYADLPIILPQVRGTIETAEGTIICDVGGDDVGARVLSSLGTSFDTSTYDMLLVLNANRPFTSDLAGSLKTIAEIESASRLQFTGIISNTHMMDDTDEEVVMRGIKLSKEVSKQTGLKLFFVSAEQKILDKINRANIDIPVLPLNRSLLKPWE